MTRPEREDYPNDNEGARLYFSERQLWDESPRARPVLRRLARLRAVHREAADDFDRIGALAGWLDRDRREPDKVLAYAQEILGLARRHIGGSRHQGAADRIAALERAIMDVALTPDSGHGVRLAKAERALAESRGQ